MTPRDTTQAKKDQRGSYFLITFICLFHSYLYLKELSVALKRGQGGKCGFCLKNSYDKTSFRNYHPTHTVDKRHLRLLATYDSMSSVLILFSCYKTLILGHHLR